MARRRSIGHAAAAAPSAPGLALHAAAERAEALLRERARLLREVQKKKQQLERFRDKASREAAEVVAKMAPLVLRQRALVRQLTALFDELLAPGRLKGRARRDIAGLRSELERDGVLAPLRDFDDAEEEAEGVEETAQRERADSAQHQRERAREPGRSTRAAAAPEVAGAEQRGQQRRSLRDIFRNLVRALHPDKARHEQERARRTEVMKELTRAYEDGDLARLLELESAWQTEQALELGGDAEQRCRELERINRELLDQVRELTRELRDTKRDVRESSAGLDPELLVAKAAAELDELDALCEMLCRLRDGRIDWMDL